MSSEHELGAFPEFVSEFSGESMARETMSNAAGKGRVVIGDKNFVVRAGIRALLEAAGVEVVAEAADAPTLLEQVRRLQPDVVIVEPHVGGAHEDSLIRSLKQQAPRAKMLVLSEVVGTEAIRAAFDAGASAYVAKQDDLVDLPSVLRSIIGGQTYVSQRVSLNLLASHAARDHGPGARNANLTHRQAEILKLIARGETTRTISERLGITPRTVHTHRSRIMQKLHVHTEGALVYWAFKMGLVSV